MRTDLARAALELVGTPFRLHGRDPATGLDCVGLVGAAIARSGREVIAPAGYSMRSLEVTPWLRFAATNGLVETETDGDVILSAVHCLQPHLLVVVPGGHIHAHAGLGRVTFLPGPLPWPVLRRWRLLDSKD